MQAIEECLVVFSLFFGKLAKVPSDDISDSILYYVALAPWSPRSEASLI